MMPTLILLRISTNALLVTCNSLLLLPAMPMFDPVPVDVEITRTPAPVIVNLLPLAPLALPIEKTWPTLVC